MWRGKWANGVKRWGSSGKAWLHPKIFTGYQVLYYKGNCIIAWPRFFFFTFDFILIWFACTVSHSGPQAGNTRSLKYDRRVERSSVIGSFFYFRWRIFLAFFFPPPFFFVFSFLFCSFKLHYPIFLSLLLFIHYLPPTYIKELSCHKEALKTKMLNMALFWSQLLK